MKLVDPKARRDYVTRMWHNVTQKSESPSELRIKLMDSFPDRLPPSGDFQIGYLGKKGTKRWIKSPEDLAALNRSFNSGDEVTLWCEARRCEAKRKKVMMMIMNLHIASVLNMHFKTPNTAT